MDATEALMRVRGLVQSEPDYRAVDSSDHVSPETLKWIGQLAALIDALKLIKESVSLGTAEALLVHSHGRSGGSQIRAVLYKVLAVAELNAPATAQGSFIAAGEQVNAYGAIAKILETATQGLLIVDPYMDASLVTDFLGAAPEGVKIRLLADEGSVKNTLIPAAERWLKQYGNSRPLEVRFSQKKRLHDRIIMVDDEQAWNLTQSIKDFAKRSHAAILKFEKENALLKVEAYEELWGDSHVMV